MKKIGLLITVIILIMGGFGVVTTANNPSEITTLKHSVNFFEPVIEDRGQYVTLQIQK